MQTGNGFIKVSLVALMVFGTTRASDTSRADLKAFQDLDSLLIEEGKSLLQGDTEKTGKSRISQRILLEKYPDLAPLVDTGQIDQSSEQKSLPHPCLEKAEDSQIKDNEAVLLIVRLQNDLKWKRKEDTCFFRANLKYNAYLQRYALFQRKREKAYAEILRAEAAAIRKSQETLLDTVKKQAEHTHILLYISIGLTLFTTVFLVWYT